MFSRRRQWPLRGNHQRIYLNIIGKTGSYQVSAIFDTGASKCAFPASVFNEIFKGDSFADAEPVQGIGRAQAVARRISIEVFDFNGVVVSELTNVEAFFIADEYFKESLFGVANAIDRFRWVMDYPGEIMYMT